MLRYIKNKLGLQGAKGHANYDAQMSYFIDTTGSPALHSVHVGMFLFRLRGPDIRKTLSMGVEDIERII